MKNIRSLWIRRLPLPVGLCYQPCFKTLDQKFNIIGLKELEYYDDIPETKMTLEENASDKANFIYHKFNMDCFADDTGLEVEALDNKPGVHSARFAGPQRNSNDNIDKLLHELSDIKNRNAKFKTIVSLLFNGNEYIFEGIVNGKIIDEKRGDSGFGYDPVFVPKGYSQTFAEMSLDEKNKISHRAIAIKKLIEFLNSQP